MEPLAANRVAAGQTGQPGAGNHRRQRDGGEGAPEGAGGGRATGLGRGGQERHSELHPAIQRRRRPRGLNRPRRGRDPAPGRVRPIPSPGGNTTRPDRRRRQGRTSSPPTPTSWDGPGGVWRLRGLHLDPGSGRMVPRRAHRAGPITALLGGGSELTRCPRRTGSSGASVLAAMPDDAAALVVGRGGGIEPALVACLPDADHNKACRQIPGGSFDGSGRAAVRQRRPTSRSAVGGPLETYGTYRTSSQ
jgi:hypothetical protein